MKNNNLLNIETENINKNSLDIDKKSTSEIIKIINNEDIKVAYAIKKELNQISNVIDLIFERFKKGGRLIYIGSGTSGRLGILDASEMYPTYGINPNRIIGIIAGGNKAIKNPIEGAEDNEKLAIIDLNKIKLNSLDTVIGIASSGKTPYVLSALKYANKKDALSVGLCMTKNSEMTKIANQVISVKTGAEIITGSTRMKAGTATKLICNMITTTLMIKLGKVYKNLMIDLVATNDKLKKRAFKIVKQITNAKDHIIYKALNESNFSCKHAIIMILKNISYSESVLLLENCDNSLTKLLEEKV
ncbi:N-acetylmuramic acid 6-phosphate etherase [Mycoplasma mycoides]|uniref:N-acetylmuramic acid 6-phosphate etherase n=1 Tax=Mycoplasma mycoides TaxID=2102 RepID=UPI00034706A1|nr:N-acetylmuramic acid 6-phosphate etherase [Mycoplasma mycoides]EXU60329.1 Ribosomal RNA small subunit methyltransferase [Mycoplasma mycoides subsp. capri PG3]QVK04248.1 N-acetylmuramic acid 6-phosphate etherase [Mycoplasma mycoides subsp. capri]